MSYAVVEAGGRQYRVEPDMVISVDRMKVEVGSEVDLDRVLLISGEDGQVTIGRPAVAGAQVRCRVMEHGRGKKIIVSTFEAKKNVRRKIGHRQDFTRLQVEKIVVGEGSHGA
jgi:large subunit ribosomal protein L21